MGRLALGIAAFTTCALAPGQGVPEGMRAVALGLEWLKAHQDADGKWDPVEFMVHDPEGEPTDGSGNAVHVIGITGLAVLAFLGDENTPAKGPYREQVDIAVEWLVDQQSEDGLFGTRASHDFIYDHALATYAICEAYGFTQDPALQDVAQKGIDCLESHRNPVAVWRYQPRDGDNDTSVTSWAVAAYGAAREHGLRINPAALENAADFLDEVTNSNTGQAGYTARGELSARHPGLHATRFPPNKGEALTAAALTSRFWLGQEPGATPVMTAAAEAIVGQPPVWDEKAGTIDHYYWYYATQALYRMGGAHWTGWSEQLGDAVVKTQRMDGSFRGSWDPIGVWGEDGGRIYSTAILILTLETYAQTNRLVRGNRKR